MSVKRYVAHDLYVEKTTGLPEGHVYSLGNNEYVLAYDYEALAQLGDMMAHQLTHREYPRLLDAWWKLRGHDMCSVCNPKTSPDPKS